MAEAATEPAVRRSRRLIPLDLLRGFLIGMAELVPGVSGGTVALVTRVYEQLIDSASHVLAALRRLATGPDRLARTRRELRLTDWWLVVPLLIGMATAVVTMAGAMSGFVTDHPEHARGLFLGLVSVSILVPLGMLPAEDRPAWKDAVPLLLAALVAFVLTSLAGGRVLDDPPLLLVLAAAAVAICALVVPGVSGSFFLLAVGLYAPTLDAVHERDPDYLAVFALGAIVGLASFVRLLVYLLATHRRTTLLAMAGLMIGSLRALWPWQLSADGEGGPGRLLAPSDPVWGPVLLAAVGGLTVAVLIWAERRHSPSPGTR